MEMTPIWHRTGGECHELFTARIYKGIVQKIRSSRVVGGCGRVVSGCGRLVGGCGRLVGGCGRVVGGYVLGTVHYLCLRLGLKRNAFLKLLNL